jgi:biopolymer transport protein ExbD
MTPEYRRRASVGLNLTPLIDIVFLLLAFFMLTAHFVEEQALEVQLPRAESGRDTADAPQVELVLAAGGELLLDGVAVAVVELEPVLRERLQPPGNRLVRLRGDRAAHLERAVQVIDAARRAGATGLDLVTERP